MWSDLSIDLLARGLLMKEGRRRFLREEQQTEHDTFDCDACDGSQVPIVAI